MMIQFVVPVITYPGLLLPGDAAGQLVGGHRRQAAAHAVAELEDVDRRGGRQLPPHRASHHSPALQRLLWLALS